MQRLNRWRFRWTSPRFIDRLTWLVLQIINFVVLWASVIFDISGHALILILLLAKRVVVVQDSLLGLNMLIILPIGLLLAIESIEVLFNAIDLVSKLVGVEIVRDPLALMRYWIVVLG